MIASICLLLVFGSITAGLVTFEYGKVFEYEISFEYEIAFEYGKHLNIRKLSELALEFCKGHRVMVCGV